jgi:hypothetical protein
LLELIRAQDDVYAPPRLTTLEAASVDPDLLAAAYRISYTSDAIRDSSPTYWRDMRVKLGI